MGEYERCTYEMKLLSFISDYKLGNVSNNTAEEVIESY
jgi:hypothetical protein